ncbi:MAG: hypothetical protein WDW38_009382 [Sanguina aurantia]
MPQQPPLPAHTRLPPAAAPAPAAAAAAPAAAAAASLASLHPPGSPCSRRTGPLPPDPASRPQPSIQLLGSIPVSLYRTPRAKKVPAPAYTLPLPGPPPKVKAAQAPPQPPLPAVGSQLSGGVARVGVSGPQGSAVSRTRSLQGPSQGGTSGPAAAKAPTRLRLGSPATAAEQRGPAAQGANDPWGATTSAAAPALQPAAAALVLDRSWTPDFQSGGISLLPQWSAAAAAAAAAAADIPSMTPSAAASRMPSSAAPLPMDCPPSGHSDVTHGPPASPPAWRPAGFGGAGAASPAALRAPEALQQVSPMMQLVDLGGIGFTTLAPAPPSNYALHLLNSNNNNSSSSSSSRHTGGERQTGGAVATSLQGSVAAAGVPMASSSVAVAKAVAAVGGPSMRRPGLKVQQPLGLLLATSLTSLLASADLVSSKEVQEATAQLQAAFQALRRILEVACVFQDPGPEGCARMVAPILRCLESVAALSAVRRTPAVNHCRAISECMNALLWVAYRGHSCGLALPRQHIADSWQGAEFFTNKILMEFKGKEEAQVGYVKALKELMKGLEDFVGRQYPKGLVWASSTTCTLSLAEAMQEESLSPSPSTAAGGTPPSASGPNPTPTNTSASAPSTAAPVTTSSAPIRKALLTTWERPPPPPPPGKPPPPPTLESLSGAGGTTPAGPDPSALFKALQKGEGITSGLRKVTDDMKTKNQEGRSGVVAPPGPSHEKPAAAAQGPAPKAVGAKASSLKGTPRVALEAGRRWVVEHQVGAKGLELSDTSPKQVVYIYGCRDSVIQVKGKVNAITLDGCSGTGVVFEDVIASVEVVNCQDVQLQCTGRVPTFSVEKSDGCQMYLTKQVADDPNFQIITAKCSALNVIVVASAVEGASQEECDPVELPIPEQFITTFREGRLVTVAAAHSGA